MSAVLTFFIEGVFVMAISKNVVGGVLVRFALLFNAPVAAQADWPAEVDCWAKVLCAMSDDEFSAKAAELVKTLNRFPVPADFLSHPVSADRKSGVLLTLGIDQIDGKTSVAGFLCKPIPPYEQVRSFHCLVDDAELVKRLPEWLAELRAEAALGRFESLAEQQARLAAQASSGNGCTDMTSLNATCTSLGRPAQQQTREVA